MSKVKGRKDGPKSEPEIDRKTVDPKELKEATPYLRDLQKKRMRMARKTGKLEGIGLIIDDTNPKEVQDKLTKTYRAGIKKQQSNPNFSHTDYRTKGMFKLR